jgi:hypothetical protein
MKRAFGFVAFLLLVLLFFATQPVFSQGIQSTIVNLPISGNWRQAVDIEKDSALGVQVFFDQNTGTILQLRTDYQIRAVNEISQQFRTAGLSGATPEGSKILMSSMFPLPPKYVHAVAGSINEGHAPKLWETKEPGNVQWFYISQLFAGYRLTGSGNAIEIHEEYVPLHVTRAENKSAGRGDALLFEAQTERPAPEAAIRRFKLPPAFKDQCLRYGWIQFSPAGIAGGESIISVAFATPVNSGIDANTVLDQLVKNYGNKVEAKN